MRFKIFREYTVEVNVVLDWGACYNIVSLFCEEGTEVVKCLVLRGPLPGEVTSLYITDLTSLLNTVNPEKPPFVVFN